MRNRYIFTRLLNSTFTPKLFWLSLFLFCFGSIQAQDKSSIPSNPSSCPQIQFKDTANVPIADLAFDIVHNNQVLQTISTDKNGLLQIPCDFNYKYQLITITNKAFGIEKNINLKKDSYCQLNIINIDSLRDLAETKEFVFQILDATKNERPLALKKIEIDIHLTREKSLEHITATTDINGYIHFKSKFFTAETVAFFKVKSKYGLRYLSASFEDIEPNIATILYLWRFRITGTPSF